MQRNNRSIEAPSIPFLSEYNKSGRYKLYRPLLFDMDWFCNTSVLAKNTCMAKGVFIEEFLAIYFVSIVWRENRYVREKSTYLTLTGRFMLGKTGRGQIEVSPPGF